MPEVIITIQADGSVKRDYHGYEGAQCLAADQHLSVHLAFFGIRLETVHFTPKPALLTVQQELSASVHTSQEEEHVHHLS